MYQLGKYVFDDSLEMIRVYIISHAAVLYMSSYNLPIIIALILCSNCIYSLFLHFFLFLTKIIYGFSDLYMIVM